MLKVSVYSRLLECVFSFFLGGRGGRDNIFFVASSTQDGIQYVYKHTKRQSLESRNLHKDCDYYNYKTNLTIALNISYQGTLL